MLAQHTFKSVARSKSPSPRDPQGQALHTRDLHRLRIVEPPQHFRELAALCLIFSVAEEALQSPRFRDAAEIWTLYIILPYISKGYSSAF